MNLESSATPAPAVSTTEASTPEISTVDSSTVDSSTVESSTVESSTVESSTFDAGPTAPQASGAGEASPTALAEVQFADFGLHADIFKSLSEMGYVTPTPIQAQAIPDRKSVV